MIVFRIKIAFCSFGPWQEYKENSDHFFSNYLSEVFTLFLRLSLDTIWQKLNLVVYINYVILLATTHDLRSGSEH